MDSQPATNAKPSSPEKPVFHKMCTYAINGAGCNRGDACPDAHPRDCAAARAAYNAMGSKKSLRVCSAFLSGTCTHPACTFLHAEIEPKAAPPAGPRAHRPAGPPSPVKGPRPSSPPSPVKGPRPAAPASPTKAHSAPRRGAAAKTGAHEDACVTLRRIQGKMRALDSARVAFETLAATIGSTAARDDANRAAAMQKAAIEELAAFGAELDEYLAALGAKPDPESDGDADPTL
jgi:hypothetical protein